MNKRILTIFLILLISCTTFISCKNDNVNQQDSTNITSENISENNYWTFDKLVEESDCCVLVSVNPKDKEEYNSKIIDNEYYTDVKVGDFSENSTIFDVFPEKITIIQKGSAFLEESNETKRTRFYYLFLNKSKTENTYYITDNINGVIETDFNYLYPFDENLSKELNKKFYDKRRKPDFCFSSR